MRGNLDAALKQRARRIAYFESHRKTLGDPLASAVTMAIFEAGELIRAYHGDLEKPERPLGLPAEDGENPAAEPKLEAGCNVKHDNFTGTVLFVGPIRCLVLASGMNGITAHLVNERLTVTEAATPEVGDVVRVETGKIGIIAGRPSVRTWSILKPGGCLEWHRHEFTIICKGGKP